jgi:hypothetical protein
MRVSDDTSIGANQGGSAIVFRVLRGTGATLLANPLSFAVAAACVWLLVHLLLGISRARQAGVAWSLFDVVSCTGCFFVLTFLACLAMGHITLMWVVGWRGDRS